MEGQVWKEWKGVDGRSERREGARETEVMLNRRCEGGVGQHNRGIRVEAERQCVKDGKEWRALAHM